MEPGATSVQQEPSPYDVSQWRGTERPPPWGIFGSIAWTLLAFLVGSVAGVAFCGWMIGFDRLVVISQKYSTDANIRYDGVLLSYIYVASSVVEIAILTIVIRIKRWPIAEYLGLNVPSRRAVFYGLALLLLFVALTDGATTLIGKNPVSEFQVVSYRTAKQSGALPLLLAVIVLLAPIAEEIMFRGFLYCGFVRRPGHVPLAILVISLLFTAVHQQYDLIGLTQIFILALLLGWTRWWSNSTIVTILMHILANFIAMTETFVYLEWGHP